MTLVPAPLKTGLDPEFLIISKTKGVVPASLFLPPDKRPDGTTTDLSYDNVAIEIRPAEAYKPGILVDRVSRLVNRVEVLLNDARRSGILPKDSRIELIPSAMLEKDEFIELESVNRVGCSPCDIITPEFTIMSNIESKLKPTIMRYRSAGFHIHQELPKGTTSTAMVSILDGILGLLDVIVNHQAGWQSASGMRRSHLGYGVAGEHRSRWIGSGADSMRVLEYRTLSSWPLLSPAITRWVIIVMRQIARQPMSTLLHILDDFPRRDKIMSAINKNELHQSRLLRAICLKAWHKHTGGNNTIRRHYLLQPKWSISDWLTEGWSRNVSINRETTLQGLP